MTFFWSVIVAMLMRFGVCQALEFKQTNISCNDIRVEHPRGFKFLYNCSTGTEVFVHDNQSNIAHAKLQENYYYWLRPDGDVISMDNSSIVTTKCRNLKIRCLLKDGKHTDETWEEFEVTDMNPVTPAWNPNKTSPVANEVTPPWNLIIGLSLLSVILIGIIGILFCCYWRRIVGFLQSCCCHRDGGCQFRIFPVLLNVSLWFSGPSRCHKDDAGQDSTTADVETPHDDVSLVEIVITEPHGSGGNEQDNTTGTVQANGLMNLKDDPGGASAVRTTNLNNGCTHGDRGPEGRPLLDQRAAVHSSDMRAEVVALANKHNFDPDRVSMCSTAQDNDVESNPK